MVEWVPIASLVLGIVGTITGIISLVLYLKKTLREKPVLSIETNKFNHCAKNSSHNDHTKMTVEFLVHNIGDRGTKLNELHWWIRSFSGGYHEIYTRTDIQKEVKAFSSEKVTCDLDLDFRIDELLNTVKFELHHTSGVEKFQATSVLSKPEGRFSVDDEQLKRAFALDEQRWKIRGEELSL